MLTRFCQWVVLSLLARTNIVLGRDFTVADPTFYRDVVLNGSIGLGESYMNKKWDSPDLASFIEKVATSPLLMRVQWWLSWCYPFEVLRMLLWYVLNPQSITRSRVVGEQHYDLSTDMYEKMLSLPMMYTCAYWKDVDTLETAQLQKMDLVCRKLQLKAGERVLELGCGWGAFAIHAAKKYGCMVTALTISREQQRYAQEQAVVAGVADRVTFLFQDYREHRGVYDKVASIGLLEHAGWSNAQGFFEVVEQSLAPNGLACIHSIVGRTNTPYGDPWINKYIFHGGAIPSYASWVTALREVPLEIEDVHSLGTDYARTLRAWYDNFNAKCEMSPRFTRMWHFYLQVSEAQFRCRGLNLWQMVLSKGRRERYDAPR